MKLGRISTASPDGAIPRIVAVEPDADRVIDLRRAHQLVLERRGASPGSARRMSATVFPESMAEAIALGDEFPETVYDVVDRAGDDASTGIGDVAWLAPVDPPILRDALVFEEHLLSQFGRFNIEVPDQYYLAPVYYKGNPTTVVGHQALIPWPYESTYLDYELEVGLVLGRSGVDLTPEEAEAHLFGVTIINDFSARDIQSREMGARLGPAKGKDFCTVLGPWITTRDEIVLDDLEMVARVNGVEWSRGTTADMMWSPTEIIAYVSQFEPTVPGEVIGSGTVGGGCGSDLGRRLSPGDEVELEVAGLGRLRNRVSDPQPARWWPTPRKRTTDG